MRRNQILLSGIGFLIIAFSGHFVSHAWVNFEAFVSQKISQQWDSMTEKLATRLGYERPKQDRRLSFYEYAELEAMRAGVNPKLIKAIMQVESNHKPTAVSIKGAIGLMQVMPANAAFCGLEINELWDERKNIQCGIKILKDALKTYKTIDLALKHYNGGKFCALNKCTETEKYLKNVLTILAKDIT